MRRIPGSGERDKRHHQSSSPYWTLVFHWGSPKGVGLVKGSVLGKLGMLSLLLTPKSPCSGRRQVGIPLTPRCSWAGLGLTRRRGSLAPNKASLPASHPPLTHQRDLGVNPSAQLPSAGSCLPPEPTAFTREQRVKADCKPPPPGTEDSEHDILI